MKKTLFRKSFFTVFTSVLFLFQFSFSAMAESPTPYSVDSYGTTTFYNLDQLKENESITQEFLDRNGNPASITLTKLPTTTRRSSASWYITLDSVMADAEYYVDVTDNRITNARDWAIYTIGCSYRDAQLTYDSNHARLSFTLQFLDWSTGTAWLQATIRGTNNEVDVTHFV